MSEQATDDNRAKVSPGRRTITIRPDRLTMYEYDYRLDGDGMKKQPIPVADKWFYLFEADTGKLYAEIYAENQELWHIEYRPSEIKPLERFDKKRKGFLVVNRTRFEGGNYRVFLSPVRTSKGALDLLKSTLAELDVVTSEGPNHAGIPYTFVLDYFEGTEQYHRIQYLPMLERLTSFVTDPERQAKLFIGSVVDNWLADGDPAEVGDHLKDKGEPARIVEDYKKQEQSLRHEAEDTMVYLGGYLDSVQHRAIDLSTQEGGEKELAVGLLHWGIVSQDMLCVAPGRVFANKLLEEGEALPARILLGEAENPNLYGAYATFKKAYAASINTVIVLLPVAIKKLRKGAGSARGTTEKVILYLRRLGIEAELKGTYRIIHERLEAGEGITKKLKGSKRARVIRSHQKLVRKAGTRIPDYNEKATRTLKTADRLEYAHPKIEEVGEAAQFLFDLISLVDTIEDYREAFPDEKDEHLFAIVGAGGDFYTATADLAERFSKRPRFLRITGGAAGFISGVVDMLDAEEKGVQEAMNNNDYAAAAGHGITAVGASMTALAGGVLLVKGITGGALFGGPFGAIVGAIGAGLMAAGMLVVAYFSDTDYQTFVRHCFLGEDHGTSVRPDWSTVAFGAGSIDSQVTALYDLLYRYKLSFATRVRAVEGQNRHGRTVHQEEWKGLQLTIDQQYGTGDNTKFLVDVEVDYNAVKYDGASSQHVKGTFSETSLMLPDDKSTTGTTRDTQMPYIVRTWSIEDVSENSDIKVESDNVAQHLHHYTGHFTITAQLYVDGKPVGRTTRVKATTAGGTAYLANRVIRER